MEKKNTWMRRRHKVTIEVLRVLFGPYVRLKYGVKVEKFRQEGKRAYLVVMNHQTAYDQFFVGMAFRQPLYYLASEDLFSMGWLSDVIRCLVAPIPIKKQTTDLQAVKNCIRVAREGGSICLAPEGNRTYDGKLVYMRPSIGSLAKKLGLPVAIFRIEGGYGIHPRWSDVVRKGKMRAYVSRVIEPEEYKDLSGEALFQMIRREMDVDEARVTGEYRHKKNAEFLERAMYVCPKCGLSTWESHDDVIHCTKCGLAVRHLPTKELEGVSEPFPHRFVSQWYNWQIDYINRLDLLSMPDAPLYTETAQLSLVHPYKNKELLCKEAKICLYPDRLTVNDRVFSFASVDTLTLLGKNKLNIYDGDELLQLKGDKRFNALKYMNLFHRYRNQTTGGQDGKFLGL